MKWRIITILFYFTFPFNKYKHCNIVTILSVRGRLIFSTCTALTAGRLVRPIVLLSSFICCDFVPSASYPVTPCLLLGSIKSALIKHYTFYLYWSECRHLYRATGWGHIWTEDGAAAASFVITLPTRPCELFVYWGQYFYIIAAISYSSMCTTAFEIYKIINCKYIVDSRWDLYIKPYLSM